MRGERLVTNNGGLDYYECSDGCLRKLGLLRDNPEIAKTFKLFSDEYKVLSESEIRKRLSDSERRPARELFGDSWVKDQDGIGSCQGQASVSCIERVRHQAGQEHVELSGDFAYALVNGGRDAGSALSAGFRAASETGYAPASVVKKWEWRKSRMSREAFELAKNFKGFEGYRVNSEIELASALAQNFFAVVAVHAMNGYGNMDQYGVSRGRNGRGNHAVCIDDVIYDTRLGGFKFDQPNSWKLSWADRGRIFLTWSRHLSTTNRYHAFYVFPSAITNPDQDNPPIPVV